MGFDKDRPAHNILQRLCDAHGQQGGTIHQFNRLYGVNFSKADAIVPLVEGKEIVGFRCSRVKGKYQHCVYTLLSEPEDTAAELKELLD